MVKSPILLKHNKMRQNLKTRVNSLGKIELRCITLADLGHIRRLLDKTKDDKSLAINLLSNQTINAKEKVTDFGNIPEVELIELLRGFIKYEKDVFKYYKETNDKEVFSNIRKALTRYFFEVNEKLLCAFQPILEKVKSNLYAFKLPKIQFNFEPYVQLAQQARKLFNSYAKMQESISKYFSSAIQKLNKPVSSFSELLGPQIDILSKWYQKYYNFLKYAVDFGKTLHENFKITEKFALKILRKYKWLITPSMPGVFIFDITEIGKRKGNQRKAMNKLFIEHFSENDYCELKRHVEDWKENQLFTPRMKIFRDCVNLLKNSDEKFNPSNLILPTLIAQIDAIQREFMIREGLYYRKGWKDKKGKKINKEIWFRSKAPEKEFGKDYDLGSDILFNVLYQGSKLGEPLQIPFTFNRHKIMHGEIIKYGRIDNTIRAFLILDFLSFATKSSKQ